MKTSTKVILTTVGVLAVGAGLFTLGIIELCRQLDEMDARMMRA